MHVCMYTHIDKNTHLPVGFCGGGTYAASRVGRGGVMRGGVMGGSTGYVDQFLPWLVS